MMGLPCGEEIMIVGYHAHPKIRRGSARARALNEGGVGTNWRFSNQIKSNLLKAEGPDGH